MSEQKMRNRIVNVSMTNKKEHSHLYLRTSPLVLLIPVNAFQLISVCIEDKILLFLNEIVDTFALINAEHTEFICKMYTYLENATRFDHMLTMYVVCVCV